MRNYPEWVISFAAILSIGAVSVSLNAWWTEEEIDYADQRLGPERPDRRRRARRRAGGPCQRAGVAVLGVRLVEGATTRPTCRPMGGRGGAGAAMPVVAIDADTHATILYTSGTTGFPKGAVSTHGAISQTVMAFSAGASIQSARRAGEDSGSGQPPCFILIVPLFHVTGCIPVMLSCFTWHFKLVMMYSWDPERALALIERHRVTNFVGVPDAVVGPHGVRPTSRTTTRPRSSVGGGGGARALDARRAASSAPSPADGPTWVTA